MQEQKTVDKIEESVEKVNEVITESNLWEKLVELLNYNLYEFTDNQGHVTDVIKVKYILLVVIILFLTTYVLRGIRKIVTRHMPEQDKAKFITVFSFAKWFIYGVVFLIAIDSVGIDVTAIFAASAALLIGVGLALQTLFQDIIAGVLILVDQTIHVGDIIEIDGVNGTVHSMTLLSTSIRTFDNQHLVVPNNNIWGNTITNVTGSKTRRVDLVFGIGYGDDMAKAERIMHEVVNSHKLVLKEPEPIVKVNQLGDSSVNFVCRPWVKTEHYLDVYWDITRQVKEAFDKEGISIPFPQQDVHLHMVEKKDA